MKQKLNYYTTFRFLWKYMKGMKIQYFLFYIGWLFHTVVGIVSPVVFGNMINQIVYHNNLQEFLKIGLGFFAITVLGIALYYAIYEMYGRLWNGMNRNLRMGMFDKLQILSAQEMNSLQHGDTVNMIQFWSIEAVNFMVRNIVHNANNFFRISICIIVIFVINPVFGLVTVIMVPLSVFSTYKIGNKIRENSEKSKEHYEKYISWLFELAGSFEKVRLWNAENAMVKKFDGKLEQINEQKTKIELSNTWGNEVLNNIKNMILVIQYGLLAYFAIYDNLTIGTITILLTYFTTLGTALSEVATNYMDVQKRMSMIEKICDFLKDERSEEEKKRSKKVTGIHTLQFRNCTFSYNGECPPVLDSMNFTINKGEKVAIVGNSGSGKSTMMNLILGLFQPVDGEIILDGTNLNEYDKASLYERVSVVFQQVLLLKGTIRENLQMGLEVSEEQLTRACKAAGIYEYILQQENGFDTVIERYGKKLSGGQRQRLGIARAYLKENDLVIMDEATSALDAKTEKWILDNWDEILQGRMCIMVSHRLSTVMKCDRVIMLKDGKVHALGTPKEMLDNCSAFRELFAI